jgi:hypothetical protein
MSSKHVPGDSEPTRAWGRITVALLAVLGLLAAGYSSWSAADDKPAQTNAQGGRVVALRAGMQLPLARASLQRVRYHYELSGVVRGKARLRIARPKRFTARVDARSLAAAWDGIAGRSRPQVELGAGLRLRLGAPSLRGRSVTFAARVPRGQRQARRTLGSVRIDAHVARAVPIRHGCPIMPFAR